MDTDVLIVGAGPAGTAAALRLAAIAPALAARTIVIDRAVFPRDKPCGGGLVRQSDTLLRYLGVSLDVPSVDVDRIRFDFPTVTTEHRGRRLFRVVRRIEFDAAMVRTVRARGVAVREGEAILDVRRDADGVHVHTTGGTYRAAVVIGADGARSLVRKRLVPGTVRDRFVALETVTPRASGGAADDAHTAVFDFRALHAGLRGYAWTFPCLVDGAPASNRGVGGSAWDADVSLRAMLHARLDPPADPAPPPVLAGATALLYHPATTQSAERVVLAGDAVGIDPWFGEGISVALGTGMLAAHAAADAHARGDFGFRGYRRTLRDSGVGWLLRRSRASARTFYRLAATRPETIAAAAARALPA
jgi:flavin-dependent dehydrogenase